MSSICQTIHSMWQEDDGVLSFDWVLLVTIVVFGLVSGITVMRDAIIDEFGDTSEATLNIDQSYTYPGTVVTNSNGTTVIVYGSTYDNVQVAYSDCGRTGP
jgi:hypothetical protein